MADNSIGQASLLLTTDATKLNNGLNQATGTIGSFVTKINGNMAYIGAGLTGFVAGAAIQVGNQLKGLFSSLQDEVIKIAADAKMGERMGIGMERFSELMASTKLDAQQLTASMTNMADLVNRATLQPRGRAGRTFQQIGLDPGELQGLNSDEQFMRIAEGIKSLSSPLAQNAAAIRIFGSEGMTMAAAIRNGLDESIETAHELGLVVKEEDAVAAREAGKVFAATGKIIEGMWKQAATAIIPFMMIANETFNAFWSLVAPIVRNVSDAFKGFAQVVGAIFQEIGASSGDFLAEVKEFWKSFKTDIPLVKEYVVDFIGGFASGIGWLADRLIEFSAMISEYLVAPLITGFAQMTRTMASLVEGFNSNFVGPIIAGIRRLLDGMSSLASLDPTGRLTGMLETARGTLDTIAEVPGVAANALNESAANMETLSQTVTDAATYSRGLTNVQDNVDDFFGRVRTRMRQGVNEVRNELGNINPVLSQLATQLADKFKAPIDTLNDSLDQLGELMASGIEIDPAVLARAVEESVSQAESALKIGEQKFATIATAGSKEAQQQLYHRDFDRTPDIQERLRAIAERQLQLQEIQARNSDALVNILTDRDELMAF